MDSGLEELLVKLGSKVYGKKFKLRGFQKEAVELIEASNDNVLVVAPTGAGKSLVAVAAILYHGKGFYLAPLRSLMREKYIEFLKFFPDKTVVITNKDYSISRSRFKKADIRILSPYKILLYTDYLNPEDGVVVVDEIHKMSKDPEMEAAITLLKTLGFRIIALSATIREEDVGLLAKWLNARVVRAIEPRPVPLKLETVKLDYEYPYVKVKDGAGILPEGSEYPSKDAVIVELVRRILAGEPDSAVMVWTPLRREANKYAQLIARMMPNSWRYVEYARRIVASGEHDRILVKTLRQGVAIHHGGISPKSREYVEELVKERKIRVVVSCYTLSHGVNLPVRHIIMTTVFDFNSKPLDPSVFHQIAGRAGRPGLDPYGQVITVLEGPLEEAIYEAMIRHGHTRIKSSIANEWVITKIAAQQLAVHGSVKKVEEFLSNTYYVVSEGGEALKSLRELLAIALGTLREYFYIAGGKAEPIGEKERLAARMSLHPYEWYVHEPMMNGDYKASVAKALEAAEIAVGWASPDDRELIMDYGLLAIYLGGWRVRELADTVQTILDANALYIKRLKGWGSPEGIRAERIARAFAYGGLEPLEKLSQALSLSELKRVVRNMGPMLAALEGDETAVESAVPVFISLVFDGKKRIYKWRVEKLVKAFLEAFLPDGYNSTLLRKTTRVALETVRDIAERYGAVVM